MAAPEHTIESDWIEGSRPCAHCNSRYYPATPRQKYCSRPCSNAVRDARQYGGKRHPKLPSGTLGAMNEMVVCADLIRQGYHVFRAVSPSCPCDLLILSGSKISRVEVTSGCRNYKGKIMFCPHNLDYYDVLAVVLPGGEIIYDGLGATQGVYPIEPDS
jgi:hypothetical protein